ncbi:MAG: flagellar basal-body MS-ring/collar protein FliF [Desulfobacterales bacterium]|nr:flagellar basal-body MS-ring/collar protein FliF [Desulfobacterales bacterium]
MEVLRQIFSQLKATFLNLSRAKQITLVALILGSLAGFIFLISWSGNSEFYPLYTKLNPTDASIILTKLKEQKIEYQIGSNGSTILIPQELIYETRMNLASEGLPQGSGVGFEIFNDSKLGMSEFAQNVNYQRALQGELSRTINRMAEIESSRVHIVIPEKSLFVEAEEPASASVALEMQAGKWLNQSQINGIVHLLSSSVPRLSPEHVTIVDQNGKLLAGDEMDSSFSGLSSDQLEYQARVEQNLENRVATMLEAALGADKAIVRLSCSFDFKSQEKTEELYLPDNQVIRSEQALNESSNAPELAPQGVPGIRSNIPGDVTANDTNQQNARTSVFNKNDRTVNYEIGKIVSHTKEPVGELTRVSIAVLVDGSYRRTEGDDGKFDWVYVPRTAEEMQKFENIVKRAVNFNTNRGDEVEIVNIPFESTRLALKAKPDDTGNWIGLLKKYQPYLKYGFLSLFLILSFLFFVRPLVRWLTEYSFGDMEIFKQLPRTVGELEGEMDPNGERLTFRDQASQMIASENEASIGVMRDWIKEN